MAIKEIRYKDKTYALSYVMRNPSAARTILLLHGWGSNKEIMMQAFGNLLGTYRHIYVDMPGFGNTPNENILTTHDYAQIVRAFCETLDVRPDVILGHSFGGKVATLLNPPCLALVASSGISVPKPLSVRMKIALFKILRGLGLQHLRRFFVSDDAKGMNAAMYETFKYVVNEDFEENFKHVRAKTLLFWGKSDTATPLWTAERIASYIENSEIYTFEGDHYFFLHHAPAVAEAIERHCYKED
jgi:pimeloyl-ACP methyl ester carboxylesterase